MAVNVVVAGDEVLRVVATTGADAGRGAVAASCAASAAVVVWCRCFGVAAAWLHTTRGVRIPSRVGMDMLAAPSLRVVRQSLVAEAMRAAMVLPKRCLVTRCLCKACKTTACVTTA